MQSCDCGKQKLSDDCANTAASVCDNCGKRCCKDCHFKFSCCGHYGCNYQEECLECHPKIRQALVEGKKVALKKAKAAPAKPTAVKQVASPTKAPPRRPKRSVRSIYQRDEPMEESKSKKIKKRVKTMEEPESKKARKRAKITGKQVLPANKQPTKPDKAVTDILLKPTPRECFFPRNLHALITEIASVAPGVASWIEGGEAFMIHDPDSSKLAELLQKHFKHSKFTSLQRQLNMYGFSKHRKGKYQGAFRHGSFHRDRPQDLDQITRSGPTQTKPLKRQVPKRAIRHLEKKEDQVKSKSKVLVPKKIKVPKAKLQLRRAKPAIPANMRSSNVSSHNAENQVPSKPIIGLKEKFKAMAATRPTLVWRT